MGKPDNQPAAEKNMIKPYKEEKPYDLALLDRRPDDLASLVGNVKYDKTVQPAHVLGNATHPPRTLTYETFVVLPLMSFPIYCTSFVA